MRGILILFSCLIFTVSKSQTMAGGWKHSITTCADNTVQTYGSNSLGQLGNGNFGTKLNFLSLSQPLKSTTFPSPNSDTSTT